MSVAAHLAPLSTVIPTQVGTHPNFRLRNASVAGQRPAAHAFSLADRAPVATCMDPGLRPDDVGHMTVREITSTRDVCATGTRGAQR